ncbi:MAG: aminoglycoside 3-N-acetyltransferase [Chloroflexi bacterium]|nr:aminoglycoside 3-N-acetyltransferase [Chloroflexota bacterium]OJV91982.1 MAG: aminoglycoside 3-N-acetyltransferase [Chloroflexi bacterium 54-19]
MKSEEPEEIKGKPPTILTRSRIIADLTRLGVAPGQTVMLHASVKAVGWIVGGPEMLLKSLLDVLTPEGTLMMVVSWEGDPYHIEEVPGAAMEDYLDEFPAFDPATSRADHRELSILSEYLRTWPGAFRSDNPLESFVAVGAKAAWLTENHPLNYGYGEGSPLAKLVAARGKVLSLGAPLETTTLIHYAECLAFVPNKRVVHYKMPVLREGKRVWIEQEEFDTSNGIVPWDGEDYFALIVKDFLKTGKARTGQVGDAPSRLYDAVELTEFAKNWMETTFNKL